MMDDKPTLKTDFEDSVTAELMIKTNTLIPMKIAVKLCAISRQEIDRRSLIGTFPKAHKLSSDDKSVRKAFYLKDIIEWQNNPADYRQPE
jgi:predicted DNA-binding transcriptional regulator AlpA